MAYEVDFIQVGDESKSGDAIALRFGVLAGPAKQQAVVVIDGGFGDTGVDLVNHIRRYYETTTIDLVICTHPDGDHSAGLQYVLENMTVRQLWMHQPWKHTSGIADLFKDGRVTDTSVRQELRKSLDNALELEKLAVRRNIPIREPFTGLAVSGYGGTLRVLGPSQEFYEALIPHFRSTPEPLASVGLFRSFTTGAADIIRRVAETWGLETLTDDGETTPENNSSAIILVTIGDSNLLFTADAGIIALEEAANELAILGIGPEQTNFIQVPHHGSQRNVGPTILDRLLGERRISDQKDRTAFVSAAKNGAPKHPSKRVLNAFRRRGTHVHGTDNGYARWHHSHDAPARNWGPSEPHPFYSEVED